MMDLATVKILHSYLLIHNISSKQLFVYIDNDTYNRKQQPRNNEYVSIPPNKSASSPITREAKPKTPVPIDPNDL